MSEETNSGEPDEASERPLIQRSRERRSTNWIAIIRLIDRPEIPTAIRDISPSGARLAVPPEMELPERFMFRVIGHEFICAVKVAWRRGADVGVQIEKVGKLKTCSEDKSVRQQMPVQTRKQ